MNKEIPAFDVVSQKLAQKMKKLGWKKERNVGFCYVKLGETGEWILCFEHYDHYIEVETGMLIEKTDFDEYLQAPLFCEICKELPLEIQYDPDLENVAFLTMGMGTHGHVKDEKFCIYYEKDYGKEMWDSFKNSDNPAEASGELWCFSREKGYIKEE